MLSSEKYYHNRQSQYTDWAIASSQGSSGYVLCNATSNYDLNLFIFKISGSVYATATNSCSPVRA